MLYRFPRCCRKEVLQPLAQISSPEYARTPTPWNDNPKCIHEHKVSPEIERLRARIAHVKNVMIEHAGRIIQNIAIYLAERDKSLERMAETMVFGNHTGHNEGERAPAHLW